MIHLYKFLLLLFIFSSILKSGDFILNKNVDFNSIPTNVKHSEDGLVFLSGDNKFSVTSLNSLLNDEIYSSIDFTNENQYDNFLNFDYFKQSDNSRYFFLANANNGVDILHYDLNNLIKVSNFNNFDNGNTVSVFYSNIKKRLYIAQEEGGVYIVDVNDFNSPFLLQKYNQNGVDSKDILSSSDGDILYIANGQHGVLILDISNLLDIKEYRIDIKGGTALKIKLKEDKLFVSLNSSGLNVYDISNLNDIKEINSYLPLEGGAVKNFTFSGDNLFVNIYNDISQEKSSITALDISDISQINKISTYYLKNSYSNTVLGTNLINLSYKLNNNIDLFDISKINLITQSPIISSLSSNKETEVFPAVFDFNVIANDVDGNIETYLWDFGDGDTITTNVPNVSKTYYSQGIYKVKVTVFDNSGLTDSTYIYVSVYNTNLNESGKIFKISEISKNKSFDISGFLDIENDTEYIVSSFLQDGFKIFDVTDPNNIILKSEINTGGISKNVEFLNDGKNILISDFNLGLKYFNSENLNNITQVGESYLSLNGNVVDFLNIEDNKYLISIENGDLEMIELNFDNPSNSVFISKLSTNDSVNGMKKSIDSKKVYVTNGKNGLKEIDLDILKNGIVDPIIKSFSDGSFFNNIDITYDNNYIFTSNLDKGFKILKNNSDSFENIFEYTNDTVYSVKLSKDQKILFVSTFNNGLIVFDITDIENPVKLQNWRSDTIKGYMGLNLFINENSNRIYFPNYNDSIYILDISNMQKENENPELYIESNSTYGFVGDNFLFSAIASDLETPDEISYFWDFGDGYSSNENNPSHIFNSNGEFTVSCIINDGNGGTNIKSITMYIQEKEDLLSNPKIEGNFTVSLGDTEVIKDSFVDKSGDFIYLNTENSIKIIKTNSLGDNFVNIEDKIEVISEINTTNDLTSLVVNNNKMFVGTKSSGVLIFNISDKNNIQEIGKINTNGFIYDLNIFENTLFISEGIKGLKIYNVSNSIPVLQNEYNTETSIHDIEISKDGKYVVLSKGKEGIEIFSLNNYVLSKKDSFNQSSGFVGYAWKSEFSTDSNKLFLSSQSGGLFILDVTNKEDIKILSNINTENWAVDSSINSNSDKLFISVLNNGTLLYDISNPEIPNLLKIYTNGDIQFNSEVIKNDTYLVSTSINGKIDILQIGSFSETTIPPILEIFSSTSNGINPLEVYFTKNSFDIDGEITNVIWDFGDGNYSYDMNNNISHVYNEKGEYTISCTVIDNDGLSNKKYLFVKASDLNIKEEFDVYGDNSKISDLKLNNSSDHLIVSEDQPGLLRVFQYNDELQTLINLNSIFNVGGVVNKIKFNSNSNFLFVSNSSNGVKIYSTSNLSSGIQNTSCSIPTLEGDTTGNVYDFEIDELNNILYIANGLSGVRAVNIINEKTFPCLDNSDLIFYNNVNLNNSAAKTLTLSKDKIKLFVGTEKGISVVDVSNISKFNEDNNTKLILSNFQTTNSTVGNFGIEKITISKDGTKLFASANDDGLLIIDITSYFNPTIINSYKNGRIKDFVLSEDETKVFLSNENLGLEIIDIRDLNDIKQIVSKSYYKDNGSLSIIKYIDISPDERTAFLSFGEGGIKTIDINNLQTLKIPPRGKIESDISIGIVPLEVKFTSMIDDIDGEVKDWNWNFGDGKTSSTKNPVHIFDKTGIFNVVLTSIDDEGSSSVFNKTIKVSSLLDQYPDIKSIESDYEGNQEVAPKLINFIVDAFDSDGIISEYRWDFGDGVRLTTKEPTVSHNFERGGDFKVEVTVVDNNGLTKTSSIDVTLSFPVEQLPSLEVFSDKTTGFVPLTIEFSSNAYSEIGSISKYEWNINGDTFQTNSVSYTFENKGEYIISLLIEDEFGNKVDKFIKIMAYDKENNESLIDVKPFEIFSLKDYKTSDVDFDEDYIYFSTIDKGFFILDKLKENIISFPLNYKINSFLKNGNFIYLNTNGNGIIVLDISDKNNISLLQEFKFDEYVKVLESNYKDGKIYFSAENKGIISSNINNTNGMIIDYDYIEIGEDAHYSFISNLDGSIFIADGDSGIKRYSLSGDKPSLLSSYQDIGKSRKIIPFDEYFISTDGDSGIKILEKENNNFNQISEIKDINDIVMDIEAFEYNDTNKKLFVLNFYKGLYIYDITDINNPYFLQKFETNNMNYKIKVDEEGRNVYVSTYGGVFVLDVFNVSTSNTKPSLSISSDKNMDTIPSEISFFAQGHDEETPENELIYFWDFGDGTFSNEKNPFHSYNNYGEYIVKCTVTDNNGGSVSDTLEIQISEDFFNLNLDIKKGWNLVSFPTKNKITLNKLFNSCEEMTHIFKWNKIASNWEYFKKNNSNSNTLIDIEENDMNGYWIYSKENCSIELKDQLKRDLSQESELVNGWNLISINNINYYFNMLNNNEIKAIFQYVEETGVWLRDRNVIHNPLKGYWIYKN